VPALTRELGHLPKPQRIVASNVAGPGTRGSIEQALALWPVPVHWVRSQPHQCGVANGYIHPERLGSDRWVALIAAWHRRHAATIVMNCGTATTMDLLNATGRFEGGMILPGLDLMKRSLATNTAQLAMFEGKFSPLPLRTADAIETGCLQAQAGALERFFQLAPAGTRCIISGGAAERVAAVLPASRQAQLEYVPHLTLEGLVLVGLAPALNTEEGQ
jgi:type III pantothenate kinase